jgi:hypothetical protein
MHNIRGIRQRGFLQFSSVSFTTTSTTTTLALKMLSTIFTAVERKVALLEAWWEQEWVELEAWEAEEHC